MCPQSAPPPDIEDLHRIACQNASAHYTDPQTGLQVFTAHHLSKRPCCGCGCRHCPYRRHPTPPPPARLLHAAWDDLPEAVDVLFWSGGKDSFLALRALLRDAVRHPLLLTTYDAATGVVAHQGVDVRAVRTQAVALGLPLLGVPVGNGEYVACVKAGLERVRDHGVDVGRIAFGDLHLRHIRAWREAHLAALGAELVFPLWDVPYERLLRELEEAGVTVRVSAVDGERVGSAVGVGDLFHRAFVEALPKGVDAFGENGEFHTIVEVWRQPLCSQRLWRG